MRIAVISARYGLDIVGGAERLARGLSEELVSRRHCAEVWTTCAHDHQSWQNLYESGLEEINGVHTRRFKVDPWDSRHYAALSSKLIGKGHLPVAEQYAWLDSGPKSSSLLAHVRNNAAEFDVVVIIPAINALTYPAAFLVEDHLVSWPCLHDEVFAYMEPFRLLMEKAQGNIFNSPEESDLAEKRLAMKLQRSAVIGSGVTLLEPDWATTAVNPHPRSRLRGNGIPAQGQALRGDDIPYILYVGRMEEGKNLPLLVEYVIRYVAEGHDLKLISAGNGSFSLPESEAFEHRGFVSEQEKARLYTGALALCQPSINESFSLTMMESWLAGRPSLVHAKCAVTRGHVRRARGGLWFETYGEFRGALDWFQQNPELSVRMGRSGREYVQRNYTWPTVVDRFLSALFQWGIVSHGRESITPVH